MVTVIVRRMGFQAMARIRSLMTRTAGVIVVSVGLAACHGGGSKEADSSASSTVQSPAATSGFRHLAVPPPASSPTCAVAILERDPARLVGALRAARLRGRGAESCFTRQALAGYDDGACRPGDLASSPGPIVLYGCAGHAVSAIPDDSIDYVPGDPVLVQADIELAGENEVGHPIRIPEHLTIGPGTASDGHAAAQVITDATSI